MTSTFDSDGRLVSAPAWWSACSTEPNNATRNVFLRVLAACGRVEN